MITRDEASERARAWLAEGREDPPDIGMYEFEHGWVAWPAEPAPADSSRPPAATGGPQIVVDGESGEISAWPPLPAAMIAEQYTLVRQTQDRFPADVGRALIDAGWSPGRDISPEVDAWYRANAAKLPGPTMFPAAAAALAEFGGLVVSRAQGQGFRTYFYPAKSDIWLHRARGHVEDFGSVAFPLGWHDDDGEIAIDEQGRVFFLHWSDTFFLGATMDEALVSLIRNTTWPCPDDEGWPSLP